MTPITKQEVEEVLEKMIPCEKVLSRAAEKLIDNYGASVEGWVRFGYEIARCRVERGDEL